MSFNRSQTDQQVGHVR